MFLLLGYVQSGLLVSWNECLNLWSRKFTRSRVKYYIPLVLWHWKILFGVSLMNVRMLSLKELKLVGFWIAGSSLFHSIMVDGRKVFLKKLYLIFIKEISLVFLVLQIVLLEGTTFNRYFGWLQFCKDNKVFYTSDNVNGIQVFKIKFPVKSFFRRSSCCNIDSKTCIIPKNTPRVFHIERTWKQRLRVCRNIKFFQYCLEKSYWMADRK